MKSFAVFDIDGTLIRWQLYHAIVDRLAKRKLLGPTAHEQLHKARMRWKRREHPEAFREYEITLIEQYEQTFKRLSTKTFDECVEQVIQEYKDQVYTYTRNLTKDLKKKGYILLAISGSHHELVGEISKVYGFDDWVGTRYSRTDGKFTGEKFVASHHKREILQQLVEKHHVNYEGSVAVGDSGSDIAMLEMVENPIAFNPDQALFAEAKKRQWKIVVERKNVIYELEPANGRYLLA